MMDENEISQRVKNAMIYGTSHPEMYKTSNDEIKELRERIKELEAENLKLKKLLKLVAAAKQHIGSVVPAWIISTDIIRQIRAALGKNKS